MSDESHKSVSVKDRITEIAKKEDESSQKMQETARKKRFSTAAFQAVCTTGKVALCTVAMNPIGAAAAVAKGTKNIYDTMKDGESKDYNKSQVISRDRVEAMAKLSDQIFLPEDKKKIVDIINRNWPSDKGAEEIKKKLEQGTLTLESSEKFFKQRPPGGLKELQTAVKEAVEHLPERNQKLVNEFSTIMLDDKSRMANNLGLMISAFQERKENKAVTKSLKQQMSKGLAKRGGDGFSR